MSEMDSFGQGMAEAQPAGPSNEERADVKAWTGRIAAAREFDKAQRKRYAIDRRYARGDRGQFEVGLPIAGTYVDILKSFLYATDPDLDCQPSEATAPPPMADILRMAREQVQADPGAMMQAHAAAQAAMEQAQQAQLQAVAGAVLPALAGGEPDPAAMQAPVDPQAAAQDAMRDALEQAAKARADELMEPHRRRQAEAKQLGETLERVVAHMWRQARLKASAGTAVGSGLTIAVGWLKASWQERMGEDPIIRTQLNDLQDNLARLEAAERELAEGEAPDEDALRASIEQQIAGLEAQVEVVIARGLAIDFVAGEDVQVSPEVASVAQYRDAPWIAHRTFMALDDAKAAFPELGERLKNASIYHQVKPADPTEARDVGALADVSERDADSYRVGGAVDGSEAGSVCVWEVWHKSANTVLTLIEGLDGYAKAPYTPTPGTSRFYPFFLFAPIQCDGERHPQSMIARTESLLDDMNRIYSNRAEHRRRCIPKTGFDATNLSPQDAKKLEAGGIGEMIPLTPATQGTPVGNMLQPIQYPGIDPALYDDSATRAMLEMAWGIQEALASSIRTAKTATEAEIQQTGTQARTSYMRDALDEMLSDLAEYTAEVCLQQMSYEDVARIAGPWAFWPEGIGIEDLHTLCTVAIRAGSSGKPDTTRQREAWAATMPIIQAAIVQVGQLRGSSPEDVADCIEELIAETLKRSGEKLDPDRFLPGAPDTGPGGPLPAQPMAPQGLAMPEPEPPPGEYEPHMIDDGVMLQ